jgi:hypothetical protein
MYNFKKLKLFEVKMKEIQPDILIKILGLA